VPGTCVYLRRADYVHVVAWILIVESAQQMLTDISNSDSHPPPPPKVVHDARIGRRSG
jgi:hypothetical protein